MARPLEKKEEDAEKKKGTWGQGDGDEGSGDGGGDASGDDAFDESEAKKSHTTQKASNSTSSSSSSSSDEAKEDTSTFVPEDKWRKSSQWASLTRKHAAAVVADTKIDATFRSLCHYREWDAELERKYLCFSDEHYIPTLLAIRGWDAETDCFGYNVHTDWTEGGPHPVSVAVFFCFFCFRFVRLFGVFFVFARGRRWTKKRGKKTHAPPPLFFLSFDSCISFSPPS